MDQKRLLAKLNQKSLSWVERAEYGLLPDTLNAGAIIELLMPDVSQWQKDQFFKQVIIKAAIDRSLKVQDPSKAETLFKKYGTGMLFLTTDITVQREDFAEWLKQIGEWPVDPSIPLSRWWPLDEPDVPVEPDASTSLAPSVADHEPSALDPVDHQEETPSLRGRPPNEKIRERNEKWINHAKTIRKSRPTWTNIEIAEDIRKRKSLNPDEISIETIRKIIAPNLKK